MFPPSPVSAAAMPEARIAVDANCAWGAVDFAKMAPELAGLGIEFIEQPLAARAGRGDGRAFTRASR